MKKILYIEPFSGISGDMFVGALLDLIKEREGIFEKVMSLQTHPKFKLSLNKVNKNGIAATKFDVVIDKEPYSNHTHGCTLNEIFSIINSAEEISIQAKELSKRIFSRLAKAESKIHDMETDHVHFHEVGAVDSIVDIVFASLLITELKIDQIISSPPALGTGTINTMHGILPVPAPATAEMLKGVPFTPTNINGELTTPTGAAILTELVTKWTCPEEGLLKAVGYGAGSRSYPNQANILRVSLFEEENIQCSSDRVAVIESNIDDMTGEFLGYIGQGLLKPGVLDYAVIPVTMKKARPGHIIQVICKPELTEEISSYLLKNTTTIGVRHRFENRKILNRESKIINTSFGDIKVKISGLKEDGTYKFKPEFDDILKIAEKINLPPAEVYSQISNEIYLTLNK
ncbi:MAG TPA: nickel pincer cofactor biosynthesis protein LarC [Lentisphaeria bacterium]|nr:MAG: TIGR00299 family protein [Lentisphaerae bacterium GWF2_38_69]HBM15951.1 nickel pincer cofactor biosynthesis protein LarC [Lentisphaeria bacterium]